VNRLQYLCGSGQPADICSFQIGDKYGIEIPVPVSGFDRLKQLLEREPESLRFIRLGSASELQMREILVKLQLPGSGLEVLTNSNGVEERAPELCRTESDAISLPVEL